MPPTGPIVVIGSINMDLVCRTERLPRPGETVIGSEFVTVAGGKGANQAVAAARLAPPGIAVHMVGRVGRDDFGSRLLGGLAHHGVDTRYVTITDSVPSGCAMILVDAAGENSIVVIAGANHLLTPADVDAAEALIGSASAVVLQLEIPTDTVRHALALCRRRGVYTILDPAPAPPAGLPEGLFDVDVLTPNEVEARALAGTATEHAAAGDRIADLEQLGTKLLGRGPKAVVLKLGAGGAMLLSRDGRVERVAAFPVAVVDTTAAGDAFTGALAVARAEGLGWSDAIRFANAAGAACCRTFGAQPSLPSREAVDAMIRPGQC
jgi:ribokinase